MKNQNFLKTSYHGVKKFKNIVKNPKSNYISTSRIFKCTVLFDAYTLIKDGRFSGATRGATIGHVSPEAAVGGNIALIEDGDMIEINILQYTINIMISERSFW